MTNLFFQLYPVIVILWWNDVDAGKRDSQEGALIHYKVSAATTITNWTVYGYTTNNTYTIYRDYSGNAQFFRVEKVGCCLERWDEWQASQSEQNQKKP